MYRYDYNYNSLIAGGILALFFIFVAFLIGVAFYIFLSLGLYSMGKKRGIKYSWIAFIPVVQLYVVGMIVKEVKILKYTVSKLEMILPIGLVIAALFSSYYLIGPVISLIYLIILISSFYYLYKSCKGELATILTIFSVFLPFLLPIFVFVYRNDIQEIKPTQIQQ